MNVRSFAIIPAAGLSVRMGRPKLLLPWNNRTLIEHVIHLWQRSSVDVITVVARADDRPIIDVCQGMDLEVVVPDEPPPDMKASVQYALRHIQSKYSPTSTDIWLMAPADMPYLDWTTIDRLIFAYQPNEPRVIVPESSGRRGHPVLLPWKYAQDVFQLRTDAGIDQLVAMRPVQTISVSQPHRFDDIDTPADYRRLREGQATNEDGFVV